MCLFRWLQLIEKTSEQMPLEWQITNQFVILFVVDTRLLVCVADSFQECCFTGVGTADHKNAKLTVFLSNFSVVAHVDGGTWKRMSAAIDHHPSAESEIDTNQPSSLPASLIPLLPGRTEPS